MATVRDRIILLTDLLLGAVHADDTREGAEEDAVRQLLSQLLEGGTLPAEVDERITTFSSSAFDLQAAATDFASDPPIQKRKLLELVAAVRDADGEIDIAEDQYMVDLATALGMDRSEYADLTLDYEVEDLRASLQTLRGS
jgi:uncharacterized tellurite resistance protein B-like protein